MFNPTSIFGDEVRLKISYDEIKALITEATK